MLKFQREILRQLPRGWIIEYRSRKHPRIVGPNGERHVIGSNPKNAHLAIINTLTAIRRAGVLIGRKAAS